jgi:hypothetical protein
MIISYPRCPRLINLHEETNHQGAFTMSSNQDILKLKHMNTNRSYLSYFTLRKTMEIILYNLINSSNSINFSQFV